MESYKHSCPVCGQHIEYTAGYCGRQMQCPICGNAIVFPAIPPKTGGKTIAEEKTKPARKWGWNAKEMALYVRDYPHWKTVGQISVPFLIIGALMAGAAFVKNKFSEQTAEAPAPIAQPDGGWDKMTEFARADQKVQQDVQSAAQAKRALMAAQQVLERQQKSYREARSSDEQQAVQGYVQSAEASVQQAQRACDMAHRRFDADLEAYQKLGGTIDYRSRVGNF